MHRQSLARPDKTADFWDDCAHFKPAGFIPQKIDKDEHPFLR
jgi:hypothetical protein